MEEDGEMVQVNDLKSLEKHIKLWNDGTPNDAKPVGYILSLEGADSIVTIAHLERAYNYGLSALSAPRTTGRGDMHRALMQPDYMGPKGHELLKEMERLNIILRRNTSYVTIVFGRRLIILTGTYGPAITIAGRFGKPQPPVQR